MNAVFGLSALVAVAATLMVITRRNAVHALLYLIVSLFAVAVVMLLLGAAFVAALEVIIYAGAIMVLFVFVIMLIGPEDVVLRPRAWIGPTALGAILLAELLWVLTRATASVQPTVQVRPKQVGIALFGPYMLGTEVAAFLLLAGLVGRISSGKKEKGRWHRSPYEYGLLLAGALFVLGLIGILVRRNLLFVLLCVEIMLNASGLAFVVAGARWGQVDGQVMFIFLLTMAAAEVAVGLSLLLLHFSRGKSLDADAMRTGQRRR